MPSSIKSHLLQCPLALLLFVAIHPEVLHAQLPRALQLELIRTRATSNSGRTNSAMQERRNVPDAQLNGALIDFHNHISKDEHYLVTNCGICRKYLSEIKSYSKKLEQAMK